ncbi:MAG: LarC family nickel insertion protein, partial [Firmicutes bacterium]|nr:LarC family nickel insertion protein [Bacillota bacterium]
MKVLYLECPSGAAGDMILAALLDCGLSLEELQKHLSCLQLKGYDLKCDTINKKGLRALQVKINVTEKQPHRNISAITELIRKSNLSPWVKEKSIAVFQALARAEAKVHGIPEDKVHFHEV